jgi:hypothetical protein
METRNCANCKTSFVVDTDDAAFYSKMGVPYPTFCSSCRFQRRMMFRNERSLYRRLCDLCHQSMITTFSEDSIYTVYCPSCWFSDKWDPTEYGLEYNPDKTFFSQLQELFLKTPQLGRVCDYATIVNCDFCTHLGSSKNCTLAFNADYCENVHYAVSVVHAQDCLDCNMCDGMNLSYEIVDGGQLSKCFYGKGLASCVDVIFSQDCRGCTDCFGCHGLRNKSHYVFNKQYSKEEYDKIIASYKLDTHTGILKAQQDSRKFFLTLPHKALIQGQKNVNVTGNYVFRSKNAKQCWVSQYLEDCAYCQFFTLASGKDSYDVSEWGANVQSCIDTITTGEGADRVWYSFGVWGESREVEYSILCTGSVSNLFGCNSLRKKQYCILNKQYTKDEYMKLKEHIIKDMVTNPYIDQKGRMWTYGEFMPYDLSFYAYNESFASQHFRMTKEEALAQGFKWRDESPSSHEVTLTWENVPESIHDTPDSILDEKLGCVDCGKAFKILKEELLLLKRFGFAIPRSCHNCRHLKRLDLIGPSSLYDRSCQKCGESIQTSYSPDRSEIIYCEKCYQQEFV